MMLKLNLGDQVSGEVEKNSFIALPGKGRHKMLLLLKLCVLTLESLVRSFRTVIQGWVYWVGNIPWRRERLPTPTFWPGELQGLYSP